MKSFLYSLCFLLCCQGMAQDEFKSYYFPADSAEAVKVYVYIDKLNTKNIEYWKVTSSPKEKRLRTESYKTDFQLYNMFEETIDEEGAKLIKYDDFILKEGKNKIISGTITADNVYKWKDKGPYTYTVTFESEDHGNEKLSKTRKLSGKKTIAVHGVSFATLEFYDEYMYKSLDDNTTFDFYQYTYYAKDVGMVKYERFYPNGAKVALELVEVLSEKEFEKLKKQARKK